LEKKGRWLAVPTWTAALFDRILKRVRVTGQKPLVVD